jgi:cytochrome c oxidase subunit 2
MVSACAAGPEVDLSADAVAGRDIALESGCAACHGSDGEGGVGPPWVGIAGSERRLEGGVAVTADTDYLIRSIVEPDADVVEGYTVRMPEYTLSDEDVRSIVTYIEELG